jgi:hypothetical protein
MNESVKPGSPGPAVAAHDEEHFRSSRLNRPSARNILGIIFVGSLLFFMVLHIRNDGLIIGNDGIGYFMHVRSVVIDHDLDFSNERAHYADVFTPPEVPHGGRLPNKYASAGMLLLWLPFYLVAHSLVLAAHALGANVIADGYNNFYQAAVCVGSIIYGGIGILFAYRVARRYYPEHPTAWAIAVLWLASGLVYYMVFEPSMSHMNSFFAVAATLCLWFFRLRDAADPRWRDFAALGAIGGIMMSVRIQDALFLLIPYASIGWRIVTSWRERNANDAWRWLGGGLLGVFVTLAIFSLQVYTWQSMYGTAAESPHQHEAGAGSFSWAEPRLLAVLFSTFHGLFSWHPVLLVATLGIALHWRRDRSFAAASLYGLAAQVYLVAAWWGWSQGDAFGGRMFLNCGLIWAVGLSALFARAWEKPKWLPAVATFSCAVILWNALSLIQYDRDFVPKGNALTVKQMTIDRFTDTLHWVERLGRKYAR